MASDPASAASVLAWALYLITPLAAVLALTVFLVSMGRGSHSGRFVRFCDRAQVPAFGLVIVCVLLTLRYF
ncbi:hypothetical protein [Jannaschia seohaensis]|uniref:Uncharacterized protein n=1 Tax=Jannaschia seohaensis TaxID=475081 RepID=A0A2Y9B336_9RHOB|nr:hypothetical protein [Jannaschia seohaensis]PWJ12473.1 hypothetical protein BCF38_11631 [Jannaschia seohaensis]SSA50954.1 hypothetical protein SAMN05421539_11631 [Jannaschia seohaensis]